MTHEITGYDETIQIETEDISAPPLCLVHYFGGSDGYPPERSPKPPGSKSIGRIAERSGNLIILEFAPPPETVQAKWQSRRRMERLRARFISRLFFAINASQHTGVLHRFPVLRSTAGRSCRSHWVIWIT